MAENMEVAQKANEMVILSLLTMNKHVEIIVLWQRNAAVMFYMEKSKIVWKINYLLIDQKWAAPCRRWTSTSRSSDVPFPALKKPDIKIHVNDSDNEIWHIS